MAVSETAVGWGTLLAVSSVTAAVIVNGVVGSYEDGKGQGYGAASNRSSVTIASVASLIVAPKNAAVDVSSESAPLGSVVNKTFTITNNSNITDAFIITAASVSGGSVQSVVFKPPTGAPVVATVGSTVSPAVPAGSSIVVVVAVATTGATIATGIEVQLTAKTTANAQNGAQSDSGKDWIWVARGPRISGVPSGSAVKPPNSGGAAFPLVEFVDGATFAQAQPGATLNFTVPFTNIGDSPALNVSVSAHVPAQLRLVAGSVKILVTDQRTGKSVASAAGAQVAAAGDTIVLTIPRLDPNIDSVLAYAATPTATAPVGSVVSNAAMIGAQSIEPAATRPAMVLIGTLNTVFDALEGGTHPVGGAAVSVLDAGTRQPAHLTAAGNAPNTSNADPFTTTSAGTFAFGLPAAAANESDYELDVGAAGYLNRRIKLTLVTNKESWPVTTLTALDGLPLAQAGGFSLTSEPVTVTGITGFFGNVPLFSPHALALTLTADRTVASAGDRIAYALDFGPGMKPLPYPGELTTALPPGIAYARGSARIGALAAEPVVSGATLSWPFKSFTTARTLTFDAVLVPGVTEGTTLSTRTHLTALVAGAPLNADASVGVSIVGGALSARSILSGRVFTDHAGDGHFVPGDAGVAGVRIYLEDGESVLTDAAGRFSFPAARPGMHVLHLDPLTLPAGLRLYHGFPVNDPRSGMRLIHGVFDSGLMADVNFAVSDGSAR